MPSACKLSCSNHKTDLLINNEGEGIAENINSGLYRTSCVLYLKLASPEMNCQVLRRILHKQQCV